MTARLAHIVRHPIKSVGWEELGSVSLTPGETLPFDRHWAVAHEAAAFAGQPDGWHAKRNFVRGVAGPGLMAARAQFDVAARRISLAHPERPDLVIDPDEPEDAAQLLDWIAPLWPTTRPTPARVVKAAPKQALTDVPSPFLSILNLASLRDLGARLGQELSIHRFRGNLWLDGLPPWEEANWIGQEIRIGAIRLRIEEAIVRCNATKVNPDNGVPDVDTLGALEAAFGKREFGVYATVIQGGTIAPGDEVDLP